MTIRKASILVLIGLSGFLGACVISPDRGSLGLATRQISGKYNGMRAKAVIPLWELRAKQRLTDNLDAYAQLQFNQGGVQATHPVLAGQAEGSFVSGGLGVHYFPITSRVMGLDLGLEAYQARYRMMGRLGPIKLTTPDQFTGLGLNLGAIGEIPISKSKDWRVVWGMGYHFTETFTRRADVDLDGWYGSIGIEITLGRK